MKATSTSRVWLRARLSVARLLHDRSAIAATEFAIIVPVMLLMFFGTVEISNGVAVDRKVTLIARTLSDLTSQAPPDPAVLNATDALVNDAYLQNVFTASVAIVQSYCATPTTARLSEIYVDSNKIAKIQWSKAATFPGCTAQASLTTSSRSAGDVVTTLVPPSLLVKQTYLLLSEIGYLYKPQVGYVMGIAGVNLSDVAYTRPRQAVCVVYNTPNPVQPPPVNGNPCPTP
jgi:Flp pilus assembly protein TadG